MLAAVRTGSSSDRIPMLFNGSHHPVVTLGSDTYALRINFAASQPTGTKIARWIQS